MESRHYTHAAGLSAALRRRNERITTMATKTLKVKQIATGEKPSGAGVLFAVAEDGSIWRYDGDDWEELPAIEVEADSEEDAS
jgi:hypothetical protein